MIVNFAEWQKQRETEFAKSLSRVMVTQKSFEQRRGQWESERVKEKQNETVDRSKIVIMPMSEDSSEEATEGSLKGNGSHHQHKFQVKMFRRWDISLFQPPPPRQWRILAWQLMHEMGLGLSPQSRNQSEWRMEVRKEQEEEELIKKRKVVAQRHFHHCTFSVMKMSFFIIWNDWAKVVVIRDNSDFSYPTFS